MRLVRNLDPRIGLSVRREITAKVEEVTERKRQIMERGQQIAEFKARIKREEQALRVLKGKALSDCF